MDNQSLWTLVITVLVTLANGLIAILKAEKSDPIPPVSAPIK